MADRPLGWRALDAWLRRIRIGHAVRLLRVKGMLDIDGVDGPVVIQGIHHVLSVFQGRSSIIGPSTGKESLVEIGDDLATGFSDTRRRVFCYKYGPCVRSGLIRLFLGGA